MEIKLTPEQEEEIVTRYIKDLCSSECGSNHPDDLEDWVKLQKAAKCFLDYWLPTGMDND